MFEILFYTMLVLFCATIFTSAMEEDFGSVVKFTKKYFKLIIITVTLIVTICTILPSKTEMYKILVASQVGTVDDGINKTKQTIDYIVDKIEEVKG